MRKRFNLELLSEAITYSLEKEIVKPHTGERVKLNTMNTTNLTLACQNAETISFSCGRQCGMYTGLVAMYDFFTQQGLKVAFITPNNNQLVSANVQQARNMVGVELKPITKHFKDYVWNDFDVIIISQFAHIKESEQLINCLEDYEGKLIYGSSFDYMPSNQEFAKQLGYEVEDNNEENMVTASI